MEADDTFDVCGWRFSTGADLVDVLLDEVLATAAEASLIVVEYYVAVAESELGLAFDRKRHPLPDWQSSLFCLCLLGHARAPSDHLDLVGRC